MWASKHDRGLYHPAIVGGPELAREDNEHSEDQETPGKGVGSEVG